MTSGGSRRRECLEPIKKSALCRPERCAAQVPACLSTVEPPLPGGKGGTPFPALKYSAPAPCRSGSKGEAPWSPKAKSPFGNLHMALLNNPILQVFSITQPGPFPIGREAEASCRPPSSGRFRRRNP